MPHASDSKLALQDDISHRTRGSLAALPGTFAFDLPYLVKDVDVEMITLSG